MRHIAMRADATQTTSYDGLPHKSTVPGRVRCWVLDASNRKGSPEWTGTGDCSTPTWPSRCALCAFWQHAPPFGYLGVNMEDLEDIM